MDLHIHTCLSPCGMPEIVPTRILEKAEERGLHAIGICDHNASDNVAAVRKAAEGSGIRVFGGMEVTTEEEIHILVLFGDDVDMKQMQGTIDQHLWGKNDTAAFGQQYIVDHEDYVTGFNERLLMGATDLNLNRIIEEVHNNNGLAIASHIDRDAFSIMSQLGMIPEELELDAVELSRHHKKSVFQLNRIGYPRVTFSDAHRLDDIGLSFTTFYIHKPSIEELKLAFQGLNGRKLQSEPN